MFKRAHIIYVLAASLMTPSVGSAKGFHFAPPADIGSNQAAAESTETIDLMQTAPVQPAAPVEQAAPVAQTTTTVDTSSIVGSLPNRPPAYFKPFMYVDLRDVANALWNRSALRKSTGNPEEGGELTKTSEIIISEMNLRSERFAGPILANGQIDSSKRMNLHFGMLGPEGGQDQNPTIDEETGIKDVTYIVEESNEASRKNVIMGATVEGVNETLRMEKGGTKKVDITLRLFIRDDSRPSTVVVNDANGVPTTISKANSIYFRRVVVSVDRTLPEGKQITNVRLSKSDGVNFDQDVQLAETKFELVGSLLDRKIVLMDRAHRIYKPFPIGVGGFDIRSADGMEFGAGPGDRNYAEPSKVVDTMTGEYPNAIITKASVWRTGDRGTNTRSRIHPSYYNGRPFLGIRDVNAGAAAGNDKGYKMVGMHYQIDHDGLKRGFVSHGCIRVRDQDLYQVDAILNEGAHDALSVKLTNVFESNFFDQFEPLMPKKSDSYYAVVYSNLNQDIRPTVDCKPDNVNNSYSIKWVGSCANGGINSKGGCDMPYFRESGYHTVADYECLTQTTPISGDVEEIIAYVKGTSTRVPLTQILYWEHHPIQTLNGTLTQEEEQQRQQGSDRMQFNLGDAIFSIFGGGKTQEQIQFEQEQKSQEQEALAAERAKPAPAPKNLDESVNCFNVEKNWLKANGCKADGKFYKAYLLDGMTPHKEMCNVHIQNMNTCYAVYKKLK